MEKPSPAPRSKISDFAIASFVIGIIPLVQLLYLFETRAMYVFESGIIKMKILMGLSMFIQFSPGIMAIIFGILGLKKIEKEKSNGKTWAILGILFGVLELSFFLGLLILSFTMPPITLDNGR